MFATNTNSVKNPPLLIDSITIPRVTGIIGLSSCPGIRNEYIFDLYRESLLDDLLDIRVWGAAAVVSLLDESEMIALGVRNLGLHTVAFNMVWWHLPVTSMGITDERYKEKWLMAVPYLCNLLLQGQRVLIHCKEGSGRTGLFAARLLVELGVSAEEAVRLVRKAKPDCLQQSAPEQQCSSFGSAARRVANRLAQSLNCSRLLL